MLPGTPQTRLDVAATLRGKRILFVGATGFVGKVALSMLLRRYPDLGKVFVLVRPGAGSSSDERFFQKVTTSPVFDPLREVFGDHTQAFLREKCEPLAGDVARPLLNFSEADVARLTPLDAIINCAGLVSFNPSLETAVRINVLGPQHAVDLARRTGAAVIHISTCFVAGNRDGEVWEDEPLVGYFPRRPREGDGAQTDALRDDDFSVPAEIADCQRIIEQVKARADDRAHVSEFRDRGAARLKAEGRDADDERQLKIAVQRERKIWVAEKLTDLGMERSQHWGWPNTYTYTKSLGDQVCASAALPSDSGTPPLRVCIVRPAIVESSLRYPFPGWNEGFTTSAPLAFLSIKGHRNYPAGDRATLDIIPVDLVASGLIMATAATLAGENELVYQLGSSDLNPLYMKRAVDLLGLHKRSWFRQRAERGEGNRLMNRALARLEPVAVSKDRFNRTSAPLWRSLADGLSTVLDENVPRWGAPRLQGLVDHAKQRLGQVSSLAKQTDDLFQLFMPFIYEREYVFRCDHARALWARLTPADQQALVWDPEKIEWRHYWLEVHMKGLEKWIFPDLEEEFAAKPRSVYTYRDLVEMFDAATKHHRSRTAMRLLPAPKKSGEAQRYSYGDLQELASRVAAALRERGVAPGDKVMLIAENRPEWGISYFGILKAGATVVPVDWQSSRQEIENLLAYSHARALVVSEKVEARLAAEGALSASGLLRLGFDDLLGAEPRAAAKAIVHQPKADELASLIFTSGTTGRPKGVMLSHRNFSSLLSKLASVFDIDRHDALLSVLPLHHTFEFTAGLLMPLMRGAEITYVDEINADTLQAAFAEGGVTGMVGVPALWQMLHRKINDQLRERGPLVLRLFDLVVDGSRKLRDRLPPALDGLPITNWGRLLFWPVHKKFGGRLRLLISGGSALPPDTLRAFRGLGFNLFEGYGLTEASPVLTVSRPGTRQLAGSVGVPLPGINVKIEAPDERGVGEVVASGPNVMMGYFENAEATAEMIRDGWLHTGDLGRLDEDNRLYIVGRKKEMILGSNGENVYPDELEDVYRDSPYVKELSIVGLPEEGGTGETVACMIVPDYESEDAKTRGRGEVRQRILEHMKNVSVKLPLYKRVKVIHFTDLELPKTSTRKVKRKLVVEELAKIERLKKQAVTARKSGGGERTLLYDVLAAVSSAKVGKIYGAMRMEELGFDSLMYNELGVALEAAGVLVPDGVDLSGVATVDDFEALVVSWGQKKTGAPKTRTRAPEGSGDAEQIPVPRAVARLGSAALDWAQRMTYERLFHTRITGRAYVPANRPFLVAANHASHLDMGLVKHAIGDWAPKLVALAAKDYFFEDPFKRAYFENFTNLVPMDRHGSLRESLRLASEVIKQGYILLIFPEGTRSTHGVMVDFKPSLGYLALSNQVDVLPMYLDGTHDALPKGSLLPKNREIAAHIGPLITCEELRAKTAGLPKSEAYREASRIVERVVRRLAPKDSVNRGDAARAPAGRIGASTVMVTDAPSMMASAIAGAAADEHEET